MALAAATLAWRAPWLAAVEQATLSWRELRAEQLERECQQLDTREHVHQSLDGTFDGITEIETWIQNPWHAQRAQAHRERFSRLADCGSRTRVVKCACPGDSPETRRTVIRCDHWRLCLECKGRRAARYRARFTLGRERALLRYEPQLRRFASGGRWSEKFATLTTPHSGSVIHDKRAIGDAWPVWRAAVARVLKRQGVKRWRDVPYWRSLEVTSSDAGHMHFHVWMLAPYLSAPLLRHLWGRALPTEYRDRLPLLLLSEVLAAADPREHRELRRAAMLEPCLAASVRAAERRAARARASGRDDAAQLTSAARAMRDSSSYLYAPIVDVRRPSPDVANELVKYIVKDTFTGSDGAQQPIDAHTFASIYAATDGARAVSTSPHLVTDAKREPMQSCCPCCGVEREVRFCTTPGEGSLLRATSPPSPAQLAA